MYQVPPNHTLCKITLFSPTRSELAVLFEWLTTNFLVQQIANGCDPLCIKNQENNLTPCMDISDEIEVDDLRDASIALPSQSLLTTLVFQ